MFLFVGSFLPHLDAVCSHLDTDVDVRVTRPLCFLEREAGAVALASRAQAMSRNVGLPRRWKGIARRKPRNEAELHCLTEATFQMFK